MKKNKKVLIFMVIFLILAIIIMPTISNASDPIKNPGGYQPGSPNSGDVSAITTEGNKVLSAVSIIGAVASVITIAILGIKYMIGSVEEKAEYKKSMIPYLIGAILLFSTSSIVSIILRFTRQTLG